VRLQVEIPLPPWPRSARQLAVEGLGAYCKARGIPCWAAVQGIFWPVLRATLDVPERRMQAVKDDLFDLFNATPNVGAVR
jgi:hypothetical protein